MNTYKIIRNHKSCTTVLGYQEATSLTIKTGLTLKEARKHLARKEAKRKNEWFDTLSKEVK